MHVFHVDAGMIHASEASLKFIKVFPLSDGYGMPITILGSCLHFLSQGLNEPIVISIKKRYLLHCSFHLTVNMSKIALHLDIVCSLRLI